MNRREVLFGASAFLTGIASAQQRPNPPTLLDGSGIPIPHYEEIASWMASIATNTANNFANGSDQVAPFNSQEYGENGIRTVFYSAYDNLWRAQEWSDRTDAGLSLNQDGIRKALSVYIEGWTRPDILYSRRDCAAEVGYYSLQRRDSYEFGNGGALTPITDQEVIDQVMGFNFKNLGEFISPWWDGQAFDTTSRQSGRYTSRSRPSNYLFKALTYYEWALESGWNDNQGNYMLPWAFDMLMNHIFRFRRELYNQTATVETYQDSGAMFMMAITLEAARVFWEYSVATGQNIDRYMPDVLLAGDVGPDQDQSVLSFVPNPYGGLIEACADLMDWRFASIDMEWEQVDSSPAYYRLRFPDTRPAPQPDTEYFRANVNHSATERYNTGEVRQKFVGDAMLNQRFTSGGDRYIVTYNRTLNAGTAQSIQGLEVGPCYWMAYMMHLTGDHERRDRYIRWGDILLYGAARNGAPFTQKQANQQLYTVFEGLEYRNRITGRND